MTGKLTDSTGFVENEYVEFSGAAAGFIATIILLHRWYSKMENLKVDSLTNELAGLRKTLETVNVPAFNVPNGYVPFIDHEHSMLFCYPEIWRKQPISLNIQGVFSEDILKLQPGDTFPGRFAVAIASPGQQSYSLKEVQLTAKQFGIPMEKVNNQLGVEISEKTEALKVPLETLLEIFGAKGDTKAEQIYEMNYFLIEALSNEKPHREYVLVNDVKSLLIEFQLDLGIKEPVVQIIIITYTQDSDLIFTFSFTDNLSDRDKVDMMRKQVLSTVQFWKANA